MPGPQEYRRLSCAHPPDSGRSDRGSLLRLRAHPGGRRETDGRCPAGARHHPVARADGMATDRPGEHGRAHHVPRRQSAGHDQLVGGHRLRCGLLKTVDNGITFEHQFDREAVVSIGDVAVSASNPQIVWVGTGREQPAQLRLVGQRRLQVGRCGQDLARTWASTNTFHIGAVRIHPENPDVVYVGAMGRCWGDERGARPLQDDGRRQDAGTKVHYIDDEDRRHRRPDAPEGSRDVVGRHLGASA